MVNTYNACSHCGKLGRDQYSVISHYRKKHGGGASIFLVDLDHPEMREHYIRQYGTKHLPTKYARKGFHGIVRKPTKFMVGEGKYPERVSITPIKPGKKHHKSNLSIGTVDIGNVKIRKFI